MKNIKLILGIALITFIFSNCKNNERNKVDNSYKEIKIAFNTWIGYSSFYIAEKEGIFKKYNLNVSTSIIEPLAEKNAGIIRGDLDGMGGTYDSGIISAASGVKGSIVMAFDRSNGTDGILVSDSINSIIDLKGKSIAVEEGFVGHFFLLYVLDKEGISPNEVNIIPMSTDQAGTAFASGKVDVAVTWEPLLSSALKRRNAKILVSSADIEPILADALFLSNKFIEERPIDTKNLVKALVEANELWINNPEKYLKFVADKWKWPVNEISETLKTVELYGIESQLKLFGTNNNKGELYAILDKANQLWYKSGVTKRLVNVDSIINPIFVNNLNKYLQPQE